MSMLKVGLPLYEYLDPTNKTVMLPYWGVSQSITLEITPVLALPDLGNKCLSTVLCLACLFWLLVN